MKKRYNYRSEWDLGLENIWTDRDKMIAEVREFHNNLFEGDPDYEDFDQCVAEGLYSFYEVK
jgi:hypothetical protein